MTLEEASVLLLVATVCAFVAQSVVGFTRAGFIVSVILGFLAAVLGGWLSGELGFPPVLTVNISEEGFPIFWSLVSAAAAAMVVGILTPSTRH